ncbi:LacI family DNA-binding transcriptional regulator [Deminuibacter soli]|uniref:LacI family transcriptional regulator n=1 Tax=Deminuibacter soli TaxID=2291815 RepID=A0A3E1ND16_9BACT|nr:substrate-binding domain-containing protein [Deminuibacter soli]RFM25752.1 LacI family transcriptional regulator [Deminuibacter soli]
MEKKSIKDVAEKAGVSTALVSYVLNNRMQGRISEATAARIRKAAKELNYQPNRIAQSLKLQKTRTIGLIVADITNTFSSQIARIVSEEARKKGYLVIIGSADEDAQKCAALIELFLSRQVDGFIIAAADNTEAQLKKLLKQKVPLVLFDRYFPSLKANAVTIDNYRASCTVTEHLIAAGKKRIGIIAYETGLFHLQERLRGYKDTLQQHRLAAPASLTGFVNIDNIEQDVARALDVMLSSRGRADAIYFTSNKLAVAGLKVLVERNIAIPGTLAVVSFDESDSFDFFHAPLTYVKQPLAGIGSEVVSMLISQMDMPASKITSKVLDAILVARASSQPS